ncbi:MAG: hypothetical protein ACE14L_10875 [Terriglobales bacterium]
MSRALQIVALLAFLAVPLVLLTPAADGPFMSQRGASAALMLCLVLLPLFERLAGVPVPQLYRSTMVAPGRAFVGQCCMSRFVRPLLC